VKFRRRQFLHLAASAAALPTMSRIAKAQAYPTRPVRIIVGYAAGGGTDITARLIGQWLSEQLHQQFVVENRPGAATNVATEAVARSAPDGYTLLLATAANAINSTFYDKLNFDFSRDIVPVAGVIRVPNVMVVNPSFPAKTVPEFIAYGSSNLGKINMGSGGAGGPDHMSGVLLTMMTGVRMLHVPYRGLAPALTDLIGGQVQGVFSTVPAALEYIKAGNLRALAVTTAMRFDGAPEIPILGDFIPGFETSQWYGICAPRSTPADIIDRLNKQINAGLAESKMRIRLAELGGMVLAGSPIDFGKFIAEETKKWAKVVKFAGVKPE